MSFAAFIEWPQWPVPVRDHLTVADRLREADPRRAEAAALEALRLARLEGLPAAEAAALTLQAHCMATIDRLAEARNTAIQALAIWSELGLAAGTAAACNVLSPVVGLLGQAKEGEEYGHRALDAALQVGDRYAEAEALKNLGLSRYRQSDLALALTYQQRALDLRRELGDTVGEAASLNHMGGVYDRLGMYEQAAECFQCSLRMQREMGNHVGIAGILNNLGNVYAEIGDLAMALECHRQCRDYAGEAGRPSLYARAIGNMGCDYARMNQFQSALEESETATRLMEELGERIPAANFRMNAGTALLDLGNPERALEYLRKAVLELQEVGHRHGVGHALLSLGRAYFRLAKEGLEFPPGEVELLGLVVPAEELSADAAPHVAALNAALKIAVDSGAKKLASFCHEELSTCYEWSGNLAPALHHYREYHRLHQEMLSDETLLRTKTLQALHLVEQARHEAEQHRSRSDQLATELDEMRSQRAAAERMALEDPLTGLANRRAFDNIIQKEFQRCRQAGQSLAVAFCDIDHFKRINDELSHSLGDSVLRAVGDVMRSVCRNSDIVARYGGEEFVLALPGADASAAAGLGERIRRAVEAFDWRSIDPTLHVTVSVGLSANMTLDNLGALLADADARLYEAKRSGRNQVRW